MQGGLSLVGRLSDSYVLWDLVQKAAALVPVNDVSRLEIARTPHLPAACQSNPVAIRDVYRG
jgi:hypothetical protein